MHAFFSSLIAPGAMRVDLYMQYTRDRPAQRIIGSVYIAMVNKQRSSQVLIFKCFFFSNIFRENIE